MLNDYVLSFVGVPRGRGGAQVVRDLTAKVEALQRELAAKDAEVAALTEATQDLQSQDLQAARIIELSKKVGWGAPVLRLPLRLPA